MQYLENFIKMFLTCQDYPGYFLELNWKSVGLLEISRVTWQLWCFVFTSPMASGLIWGFVLSFPRDINLTLIGAFIFWWLSRVTRYLKISNHSDGKMQTCGISITNTLEIPQPSLSHWFVFRFLFLLSITASFAFVFWFNNNISVYMFGFFSCKVWYGLHKAHALS